MFATRDTAVYVFLVFFSFFIIFMKSEKNVYVSSWVLNLYLLGFLELCIAGVRWFWEPPYFVPEPLDQLPWNFACLLTGPTQTKLRHKNHGDVIISADVSINQWKLAAKGARKKMVHKDFFSSDFSFWMAKDYIFIC